MNKPAVTLLAVVLLLAVAIAAWFTLGQTERGGRAETDVARAPAAAPAGAGESALVKSEQPVELAPAEVLPNAPALAQPAVAEERRAAAESSSGRRIHGLVRLPAGAPSDDSLRVVAVKAALEPRKVYGTGGVLADLARDKHESSLGTASVAPDGSFTLALASGDDVWLALDGRFLYSVEVQRVPAGADAVELAAELGGCLAGRVRVPDANAAALKDLDAELSVDGQNFSMAAVSSGPAFPRRARIDGEGRFELRALPSGFPHELEVRPEELADAKVGGLEFEPGQVRALEVVLTQGATVRGSVRDDSGAPVEGAEVGAAENAMWGFPGEELAKTKSDASGAFVLEHVAPGKSLLRAEKDGSLESEIVKLDLRDGDVRERVELVLGRGASISGIVRNPDGSPAGGAKVKAGFDPEALVGMGAWNAIRGAESETTSDSGGAFVLTGLGKGPFVVSATVEREAADGAKEKWLATAAHVNPDTRDLELTLAKPSVVTGRVRDAAGAPVTEFHLRMTKGSGAFFLPGETRGQDCKDPEGDFVLRDLEQGSWTIDASARGFGPMQPVELALPRPEEKPLELVLAPAASVAGSVLDPSGAPASGAKVTLHVSGAERIQRLRGDVKSPEALSAADGSFVLENLGGGMVSIYAERAGLAASEAVSVETRPGERAEGVVLKLRKGAVVTGEVYGADGKPATGITVLAQEQGQMAMARQRADNEGRFRFDALAPGSWSITAMLEESDVDLEGGQSESTAALLGNLRFTMVSLEDGEEEHVVLGAPPKDPVLVRGQVRHGKDPVAGGLVSFIPEGSKGFESMKMATFGGDGRYKVELPAPGRYVASVQINASGGVFQQDNIEFRANIPEVEEHELDFTLPLGEIRGLVRGADRKPLSGTRVSLVTEGGLQGGSMLGGHFSEATTGDDGRYSFQFLRPGTYAVAAGGALFGGAFGGETKAGRLVRTNLHVDEGKTVDGIDFELEEPGKIQGRVVDAGGAPVKDVSVFVRDAGGHLLDRLSMITTSADGSFEYSGVSEGDYVVSARGKNLASAESAPVHVPKSGNASVELVVAAGTKLVIEVVDDDGQPVEARVTVTDASGREMQGMLGFADMAAGFGEGFDSSKQTVGPLAPGAYTVTAVKDGGDKTSRPVTLDGQPERKLKLRLR